MEIFLKKKKKKLQSHQFLKIKFLNQYDQIFLICIIIAPSCGIQQNIMQVFMCSCMSLGGHGRKQAHTAQKGSGTQSMVCEPLGGKPETYSQVPQGQSNFYNNTKMSFAFFMVLAFALLVQNNDGYCGHLSLNYGNGPKLHSYSLCSSLLCI